MRGARLLSNGRYAVLLTDGGSGFSIRGPYALTAWEGDRTRDADGLHVFLRDVEKRTVWSPTRQPFGTRPGVVHAAASDVGTVHFTSHHDGIDAAIEVCVAPDADVEIRRVTLRNGDRIARHIEVTTYAEIVLNTAAAHAAHPAFAKLFVQTAFDAERAAVLAWRRPRSRTETHPWLVHALHGSGPLEHETDRRRFLGRGGSASAPLALVTRAPLSGTTGNVLDPVASLRRVVTLEPSASATLALVLGAADDRAGASSLAARFADAAAVDEVFAAARTSETARRVRLGCSTTTAEHYQTLAGAMLYGDPRLRADPAAIAAARGGLDHLSPYGVGDGPVVVARVESNTALDDVLRMLGYWRAHAIAPTVVLLLGGLEPDETGRRVAASEAGDAKALARAALPVEHVALLEARADLLISESLPTLPDVSRPAPPVIAVHSPDRQPAAIWTDPLRLPNGFGGFSDDGTAYILRLHAGDGGRPPMPWTNVVANEHVGFLASEAGVGLTWSRNSRENRLTPWSNDPVTDPPSHALYVRDEAAHTFWSPQPAPAPPTAEFEVRHGFGFSQWRHTSHGLVQDVTTFVPQTPPDPVRVTRIRITNTESRSRTLAIVAHDRLVLGVTSGASARFVVTEHDAASGALFARNRTNFEFADSLTFGAVIAPDGAPVSWSGDRATFLGPEGDLVAPAAVTSAHALDGHVGAALDPALSWQVTITIAPGETREVAFLLGEACDPDAARTLVVRYRTAGALTRALRDARTFWAGLLGTVQVTTPVPEIDLLANGWLGYQTLVCRLWARSAFYQSGGAYGFRDQLQDAASLVHLDPAITRAQILRNAAHQFVEGDVLHWWHPPTGRGIRTRFSDDLLWLPLLTAFYVRATGDWGILDEPVGFRTTRALEAGEDEAYLVPDTATERASVYEHCCRALDRGMTRGVHGLPLMGTGDWNDGMNRVGREGRGESVWVGFFLHRIIEDFAALCERRGDQERLERHRRYQADLRVALEGAAWDGGWYRRAYYDDGTPLGSAENEECRIDVLAQSWAVLSGAVSRERAARAMDAAMTHLVSPADGIIRLLAPPFDRDPHDPGYIKGYVPGVRENGGQYTHGALWAVQAVAELGRRNEAAPLLAMLTPIRHARDAAHVATYQVEPYVVAADVYGAPPHVGRGGWTWYTGSSGWMYRVVLESILGVHLEDGDTLRVHPCIPDAWDGFSVRLRLDGDTRYEVVVRNPSRTSAVIVSATADGTAIATAPDGLRVPVRRDGRAHRVDVTLGAGSS